MLKVSLLALVLSVGMLAPASAQSKKPRKTFKQILLMADSLRLQLRHSADNGRMLQWGDSILMAELGSVEKYWGCFFCFIVFCIFAL